MGLLDFFKRQSAEPSQPSAGDDVQRARTRARQRLIGAVVLVAIGVIGLPMIFDTAPRPVAAGIPIEIPAKEAAAPLTPPPSAKPVARAELPAEEREEGASASKPAVAKSEAKVEPKAESKPEAKAESKPAEPKPAAPKPDAQRAAALLEGRDAPSAKAEPAKAASSADGRFVVQVGAFAENDTAREARLKVEKLGIKTYTQVVEKDGKRVIRVRVGPYDDRAGAEKVAGQIRGAGMTASVLTL